MAARTFPATALLFALEGLPPGKGSGWLQLNRGTCGQRWAWLLNYDRQAGD